MGQKEDLERVGPEVAPHCSELPLLHTLYKHRVTGRQLLHVKAAAAVYENLVNMWSWWEKGQAKKEFCFLQSTKLLHWHKVEALPCVAQTLLREFWETAVEVAANKELSLWQFPRASFPLVFNKWILLEGEKTKNLLHAEKSQEPSGKVWNYQSFRMEKGGKQEWRCRETRTCCPHSHIRSLKLILPLKSYLKTISIWRLLSAVSTQLYHNNWRAAYCYKCFDSGQSCHQRTEAFIQHAGWCSYY